MEIIEPKIWDQHFCLNPTFLGPNFFFFRTKCFFRDQIFYQHYQFDCNYRFPCLPCHECCKKYKGIGNVPKSFVLFATFMSGQGTPGQYKVTKYTKNLTTLIWPEERSCCQVQPSRLHFDYQNLS